jgi:hypothetical protein
LTKCRAAPPPLKASVLRAVVKNSFAKNSHVTSRHALQDGFAGGYEVRLVPVSTSLCKTSGLTQTTTGTGPPRSLDRRKRNQHITPQKPPSTATCLSQNHHHHHLSTQTNPISRSKTSGSTRNSTIPPTPSSLLPPLPPPHPRPRLGQQNPHPPLHEIPTRRTIPLPQIPRRRPSETTRSQNGPGSTDANRKRRG